MDATPIERVASPAEFAELLAALPLDTGLPYALAGYGMGRRAQILRLRWTDVDLDVGAIEWGVDWEARKYDASRRVVPTVPPLLALLKSPLHGARQPEGWPGLPAAHILGPERHAEHDGARSPGSQALGGREAPADHLEGGSPHGRDMARCRRRGT
jgi:integrase